MPNLIQIQDPIFRLDLVNRGEVKDRMEEIIEEHEASQEVWHAVNEFLYYGE